MNDWDKKISEITETDIETFTEELDLILGSTVSLRNVINDHMDTNDIKYSEPENISVMLENEGNTKRVNDYMRLYSFEPLNSKLKH